MATQGKSVPVGDAQVDVLRRETKQLRAQLRHNSELSRLEIRRLRYKNGVLQQRNNCLAMEVARSAELGCIPDDEGDSQGDETPTDADSFKDEAKVAPPVIREDVPEQRDGKVIPAAMPNAGDGEAENKEVPSVVRENVPEQWNGEVLPAAESRAGDDEGNVEAARGSPNNLQSILAAPLQAFAPSSPIDDEVVEDRRSAGDAYDGGVLIKTSDVEVAPSVERGSTTNLQSVLAAPLTAFASAPASTDDIRPIDTNNQQKSQDLEGLPPKPKRKRRRIRKRKRRRSGRNKKSRLKHSPVTPPNQHARARRRVTMTYKSFGKEITSEDTGHCPISGFHTIWDRTSWPRRRLATGIG